MQSAANPHVLVAGATGYLAGFVTQELADRGFPVRAMGRSHEGDEEIATLFHP